MNKCILCKATELLHYGDDIFGEVFCRDCFNKYCCLHCHRMNIVIQFDNNNNVIDMNIKNFYGETVANNSVLVSMFEPGYKFKLYCKECWETQDLYKEEDNNSVEPDDDEFFEYSDNDDIDDNDLEENQNMYYVGKGKYDLY